jgi:hypothetical protein
MWINAKLFVGRVAFFVAVVWLVRSSAGLLGLYGACLPALWCTIDVEEMQLVEQRGCSANLRTL